MARGKAAARNANRRTTETQAALNRVTAEMQAERQRHRDEVAGLKNELEAIKRDRRAEVRRMVDEEVQRSLDDERRRQEALGMSRDIVQHLAIQKDRFIMRACQYVSMTTGVSPTHALTLVLTWCTDTPFRGMPKNRLGYLLKLGIWHDGWVARTMRVNGFWERAIKRANGNAAETVTLDEAVATGHDDIHPRYKPSWYPPVEHGGIVLTGAEPSPDA